MTSNDELRDELAELRAELAALRSSMVPSRVDAGRSLSRRNLLRAVPVAAVGAGIAALSASPAAAVTGDAVLLGRTNDAGTGTTVIKGGNSTSLAPALSVDGGFRADAFVMSGLSYDSDDGLKAYADDPTRAGLTVQGSVAVGGQAADGGNGLVVFGQGSGSGITVDWADKGELDGPPRSAGAAIAVATSTCDSLEVTTAAGTVLNASVTSTSATADAATIRYAGKGRAVYAESTTTTNVNGTITGVNDGAGIGVWGENKNANAAGIGVVGVGNKAGRGAQFSGGVAQARLVPGTATTHPWAGKTGDFFVDSTGRLWYCQKTSTTSVTATWKQLA